jgi:hypothetical protein
MLAVCSASKKMDRGGVIIEASLWVAFLAVLMPVLTDIFFISNTYLSLNQIAHEAIVTEISFPTDFVRSPGSYGSYHNYILGPSGAPYPTEASLTPRCIIGSAYAPNFGQPGPTYDCPLEFMKWRVKRLIESHKVRIDPNDIEVSLKLENDGEMYITLETTYQSFSYFFKDHRIKNSASAHYVGSNQTI